MHFKSLFKFLSRPWKRTRPICKRPFANRSARLLVEMLERRELLANDIPTLVSAGILPVDGSTTTNGLPTIQVQYSETMSASVLNAKNYVLLGSSGDVVPIDGVSFIGIGGAPANSAVELFYNGGNQLVVDTYTLFLRGDQMFDVDDNFAMAQPGQLFVSNSGQNSLAVVNLPGNGTVGAVSNYNLAPVGVQAANPYAVTLGDLDGDGITDLIVVNAGTNQALLFKGHAAADGGGYSLAPDLTLDLSVGAVNQGKSVVAADFNKDGKLDLAIANFATSDVTFFLNTSASVGTLAFSTPTTLTPSSVPVGLAVGDFDGDTNLDLAVAVTGAPGDLDTPTDSVNDYRVDIFAGNGAGGFAAPVFVKVGDTGGAGVTAPTSIGVGLLNGDARLDLVVGGTDGIAVVINNNLAPGSFNNFAVQNPLVSASNIVSLAVGRLDSGLTVDIVATTSANTVEILRNTNAPTPGPVAFLPTTTIALASGTAGRIAIGDLNGDGKNDIVVTNAAASAQVSILQNATFGGSISAATDAGVIEVFSKGHGLVTGQRIIISGAQGNTTANGTWTITVVTKNITSTTGLGGNNPISVTSAAHGLQTGDSITIAGNAFGAANGTFTITRTGANSFTLNGTNGLTGGGAGGAWTSNDRFTLDTSNAPAGAYTGGGSWVRTGTVGNAQGDGTNPIVITSNAHGLTTGASVTISGSALFGAINSTFIITVVDANTFTLNGTSTAGADNSGTATWITNTSFFAPTGSPYTVESTPRGVVIGDTNQDGKLDVITANNAANSFTVLLGDGAGALQTGLTSTGLPTTTNGLAVADLNRDGIPDLILINNNGSTAASNVTVRQGQLGGTYGAPINFTANVAGNSINGFTSVAVGDINGDGRPDIVYSAAGTNEVGFLVNNIVTVGGNIIGSSFTPIDEVSVGRTPNQVVLADFNGDGKLDLAVAHNGGGGPSSRRGVTIRLANPLVAGAFQNSFELNAGVGMSSLVVGDFNRDGFMDIAAAEDNATGKVWINFGTGTGLFSAGQSFNTTVPNPGAIKAADFNGDGYLDVVVSSKSASVNNAGVAVLLNNGDGTLGTAQQTDVIPGTGLRDVLTTDVNQDGFVDAIVTTTLPRLSGNISAIDASGGLIRITSNGHGLTTGDQVVIAGVVGSVPANGAWTITVTSPNRFTLNGSTFSGTYTGGGTWTKTNTTFTTNDNVFVLIGIGNGTFKEPVPYLAGGTGTPYLAPSFLGATPNPLIRVTTFTSGGTVVNTNLVTNGDFELRDLTGEKGNLLGWDTFRLAASPGGSQGEWYPQTSDKSPLSGTTVPLLNKAYRAMLDQNNQTPYTGNNNPNAPGTYAGTHVLYQDITIPANANKVTLSLNLYIDNTDAGIYSDTATAPALDYRGGDALGNNQQVRIDIMDPLGQMLGVTPATGVLRNLFLTNNLSANTINTVVQDLDLTAFAGQTVRIRIASANNQGRLIVGVDNVKVLARFADTTAPTLTGLGIANPAYINAGIPHTNDPTLIGTVNDNGGLAGVSFITIDVKNNGFGNADDLKITEWDALGNFGFFLPNTPAGQNTVGVQVVDRAGNKTTRTFTFFMQTNSVTEWEGIGPQGITTQTDANLDPASGFQDYLTDYTEVSGRVTVTVPDISDPTGNSYFVGSANGGIWKTIDGGKHWTSLTNDVTDSSGNPVPVSIGGMAQSVSSPNILYAATGVGDNELDSKPGTGVLKSSDGGKTWRVIGNSATVLGGAKTVKVVISSNDPNVAYVAAAADGANTTGAVYKTTNGGTTWINVLDPAQMVTSGGPVGTATVDSVTDLIIDPVNNNRILIGVGQIGLVPAVGTGGVWFSSSGGAAWTLVEGGVGAVPNNTLPNEPVAGDNIGRVTVAIGQGATSSEGYVYALIGTPPGNNTPPNVDWGTFAGLYRTKDNMLNFTKVMLKENTIPSGPGATHNFVDINLMGNNAANAGAMLVDPTNPNVVYVGGTSLWDPNNPVGHALIRVDTGNMQDASLNGDGTNDGDDITKAARANTQVVSGVRYYDPNNPSGTPVDPYVGEGVYWYDVIQKQSGRTGYTNTGHLKSFLPSTITSLAFDAQGRLLVGTNGGIWRGVSYGFGYDFTSGGRGILAGGGFGGFGSFSTPGMTLTSLNGNLQISSISSVAIDPFQQGVYFTTQFTTGVAQSAGSLSWLSTGLTGPTINNNNLNIPNAGYILTSNPAPGTPAGTPVTLYRVWQYASGAALQPETSVDNGATWTSINSTGINPGIQAGLFPAFAVNPSPVKLTTGPGPNDFIYQNELMFGTQFVYFSGTSGTVWDPIPSTTPLSAGFNISALAFATAPGVLYAATEDGRFFRSGSYGADFWPEQDVGLPVGIPNVYIKGIATDPTNAAITNATNAGPIVITSANHRLTTGDQIIVSGVGGNSNANGTWTVTVIDQDTFSLDGSSGNAAYTSGGTWTRNEVFVAYAGTGTPSHVFRSRDGGITWDDVSATLPDVPAYSVVIDRTPGLGAPNGKVYVATEVGVFFSVDGGDNWARLGQGMPNVPVVGLTFDDGSRNGGFANLAAATLGRGVYTINTNPLSFIDDQVVDQNTPSQVIPFSVNDPGLPSGSYTVTAASDNQQLVQNAGITLGGSGKNRTIQFTPVLNANTPNDGVANITITVTQGTFTFSQSFQVTVNFVNQLPTISTIGSKVTDVNTPLAVSFLIGDVETPANALIVTALSTNSTLVPNTPANLAFTGSGSFRTLTITPANGEVGTTVITISVTDGDLGVSMRTFNLLVTEDAVLPFTDDFNRANSPFLGPGWNVNVGDVQVVGSKASAAPGQAIASLNQLAQADIHLQMDVNVGANQDAGLIARYAGAGANNYYQGKIVNSNGSLFAQIEKNVNGVVTTLASVPVATGIGTLRFEVADNSLRLFYGAVVNINSPDDPLPLVAFANDSQLTAAGTAGFRTQSGNLSVDNFRASAIALQVPAMPFADDFDTQSNGEQLGVNWVNRSGNFQVNNQAIVAAPGLTPSLATLFGVSLDHSLAQAKVNVGGVGNYAGVVVRYSATGYYYGQIRITNAGPKAEIYRVLGKVSKKLATVNVASGTGYLRLEAVGSSLKLFHGATPLTMAQIAFAYDSKLTAGAQGIRASAGMVLDDFSADAVALIDPSQPPASLPFTDNFTSPALNGDQLSRNWQYQAGNFTVRPGNVLQGDTPGAHLATVFANLPDAKAEAIYDVTGAVGQAFGLVARYNAGSYYLAQISRTAGGFQAKLLMVTPAGTTTLASTAVGGNGMGTARFEMAGNSLKLYIDNGLILYANNSKLTTGFMGVRATQGVPVRSFSLDAITLIDPSQPPTSLPFQDAFPLAGAVNGDQLSRNWDERQGNFNITAGETLEGNAPANLAVVHGLSLLNASAQADLMVGAGEKAGVVVRYDAVKNSYYLGQVIANAAGTAYTIQLLKVTGATTTLLATKTSMFGNGTIHLEVVGNNLKLFYFETASPPAVPPLVLFAYDKSLSGPGSTGIFVGKNAELDNFVTDEIQLNSPAPPQFTDHFTTASYGNQLARDWTERKGNFTVNGTGRLGGEGNANLATVNDLALANASVQADFVTLLAGQKAGLVARYQANGNHYLAQVAANAAGTVYTLSISKVIANVATTLVTTTSPVAGPGVMRFEVIGSNLKLFYDTIGTASPALRLFAYDGLLSAPGLTGIYSSKDVESDEFIVNEVTLTDPSAALPFTDAFSNPANGNQLGGNPPGDRNWQERQGNFMINLGEVVGVANANLATVFGAALADVSLSAKIDLAASQQAGLIARYQANGSYFIGRMVVNAAGVVSADISRYSGGMFTKLNTPSTTFPVTGTAGTLRFEVSGTSLKLYFTPTAGAEVLVAYAFDKSIAAAGLAGLRLTKDARADDFTLDQKVVNEPGLLFQDSFPPADGTLLTNYSDDWTERQSLFDIQGNALHNTGATIGIATVNGTHADTQGTQDIDLPGAGTHAVGLVARYNPANGNYYLGRITSVNGLLKAEILKRVGNAWTVLFTTTLPGIGGAGTMRFEVVANNLKLYYAETGNPLAVVAYANDNSLTGAGLSGVYVGVGESIDTYTLDNITLNNPGLAFNDLLDGATGDQLSHDWLEQSGNFSISGNALMANGNKVNLATVNGIDQADTQVAADVTIGAGQDAGIIARYQETGAKAGSYYLGRLSEKNGIYTAALYRYDAATKKLVQLSALSGLTSTGVGAGAGTLSLEVVGANLKLYFTGLFTPKALVAYAYDANYASGTVGIRGSQGVAFDNFSADVVSLPASQAPGYTENFAANPPTEQLSTDWLERAGNFNVQTGDAIGQAALNIATINGVVSDDIDFEADFTINQANQFAGLIARYSGDPGKDTYYAAQITYLAANSFQVEIVKVIAGVKTSLASTTVAAFNGGVRFLVVGNSLSLYLDGSSNPTHSITDDSIVDPGVVGMSGSAGAAATIFKVN